MIILRFIFITIITFSENFRAIQDYDWLIAFLKKNQNTG